MATTYELTVNDAGDPEAVTVRSICKEVVCIEKPTASGWPRKFESRRHLADTPVQKAEGGSAVFPAATTFLPDDVPGYLNLLAAGGSTTFCIEEK